MMSRVAIGVGLMTAGFTSEVLAPAPTKEAATRATLARIVRLHDTTGVPTILTLYATNL